MSELMEGYWIIYDVSSINPPEYLPSIYTLGHHCMDFEDLFVDQTTLIKIFHKITFFLSYF